MADACFGNKNMTFTLQWADHVLNLGERTHVMGILNVTPDSFSDGGRYFEIDRAIDHARRMVREGADIIDVGGQSTRPFSKRLSTDEELARVIPVIESLAKEVTVPISIDTYNSAVAEAGLTAGASIINDISALRFDPQMAAVVAANDVPLILMHMKGTPEDMQKNPVYDDVVKEIITFLRDAASRAVAAGVKKELIIVDPGIGFGKTFDHNLLVLRHLDAFQCINQPILLGTSNKAFIGHILDKPAHERATGTMATVAAGVMNGAHIVRVHHVKQTKETVRVLDAIKNAGVAASA